MHLCHIKNAELSLEQHSYKNSIVFRRDIFKDASGAYAVFTEQNASASIMATARVLDTIARMPGISGNNRDGRKAYTQVPMSMHSELLRLPSEECPDVWISLPKNRFHKWLDDIEDPNRKHRQICMGIR